MNKYLGPAWSCEELSEILNETPCTVLSVFSTGRLVGVVSVALPEKEHPRYGITGIAVKPDHQRQGFGTEILSALKNYYRTVQGQEWIAFVNPGNRSAQQFMEKQGWSKGEIKNKMYQYSCIQE